MEVEQGVEQRAKIHAALGDPGRLAIVDALTNSDRAPSELVDQLGLSPSLLVFHLDTLERAGLIRRIPSAADRRRKYVQLMHDRLALIDVVRRRLDRPVVFVCTHNAARSQLAAAIWRLTSGTATSAGTEPSPMIHAGAVAAARRAGLELGESAPRRLAPDDLTHHVITVCDRAHEQLADRQDRSHLDQWHWSIPDPSIDGSDNAFDQALALIRDRIDAATHINTWETT